MYVLSMVVFHGFWLFDLKLPKPIKHTIKPSLRQNPDKETSREYTVYVPNVCVTYPNKGYNMFVDNLSCSCFNINFFCSKLNNSDKIMIILAMPGKFDKSNDKCVFVTLLFLSFIYV